MTDQRLSDSLCGDTHLHLRGKQTLLTILPSSGFMYLIYLFIYFSDSPLQSLSFASFPTLFYTKYRCIHTQLCYQQE